LSFNFSAVNLAKGENRGKSVQGEKEQKKRKAPAKAGAHSIKN